MDSSTWNRRISRTSYRFVRVSRATGDETGLISVLSGGTITRNDDTRIKESAEAEMVSDYDFGPDLVRIYLVAEWEGGERAEVPLGTVVPVAPARDVTAGFSRYTL